MLDSILATCTATGEFTRLRTQGSDLLQSSRCGEGNYSAGRRDGSGLGEIGVSDESKGFLRKPETLNLKPFFCLSRCPHWPPPPKTLARSRKRQPKNQNPCRPLTLIITQGGDDKGTPTQKKKKKKETRAYSGSYLTPPPPHPLILSTPQDSYIIG